MEVRKKMYSDLSQERWYILFIHPGRCRSCGRVQTNKNGKSFRNAEKASSNGGFSHRRGLSHPCHPHPHRRMRPIGIWFAFHSIPRKIQIHGLTDGYDDEQEQASDMFGPHATPRPRFASMMRRLTPPSRKDPPKTYAA